LATRKFSYPLKRGACRMAKRTSESESEWYVAEAYAPISASPRSAKKRWAEKRVGAKKKKAKRGVREKVGPSV
jgi:hypothetical protein